MLFQFSDGDPENYIAYYRRATVFLAMGKSKAALPDLTKVIELKMDFTAVSASKLSLRENFIWNLEELICLLR